VHGHVEVPTDDLRHLAGGYAFFGDGMEGRAGWSVVERQGKDVGDIESMGGGPAIGSITDVTSHTLSPGDLDQCGHKAVVPVAMTRRGESNCGGSDALLRQIDGELGGSHPGKRTSTHGRHGAVGTNAIVLIRHLSQRQAQHTRGNEERAIRSGHDLAKGLDDLPISISGAGKVAREG
jgi:hypothetical protein